MIDLRQEEQGIGVGTQAEGRQYTGSLGRHQRRAMLVRVPFVGAHPG